LIPDEQALVARAQQGDMDAFEALVVRYERYVYNLALRLVANPDEAEDLAQQAFVRAWRALPKFRGQAKFSTWLYRIVTNVCYSCLPQIKKELAMLVTDEEALNMPDERQAVEPGLLDTELKEHLHLAIEALPEGYRLLLILRHLQELSYEEIVQVTGLPLGTVKTGIFRARRRLKVELDAYEVNYV
jgi:RNA polymerase sigma-70 factor (ECF subfamily)